MWNNIYVTITKVPYRIIPFETQSFYHIYNRGVEKRQIFSNTRDYQRFLQTIYYYQFAGPKPKFSHQYHFRSKDYYKNPKIVEIICYCLMPNHFHILLRQVKDDGVKEFMQKVINSYTKYFNTKNSRVGPLLQGTFKAVSITSDAQLMHVSRYIHINPLVSNITLDFESYPYSSYSDFIGLSDHQICVKEPVLGLFKNSSEYQRFVIDHSNYTQDFELTKHLFLDSE